MILNDKTVVDLCIKKNMISPYCVRSISEEVGKKVISYGLSSFGYDIRLGYTFETVAEGETIDPKTYKQIKRTTFVATAPVKLRPHEFILSRSIEEFKIPEDVMAICLGKSTYARCGIVVNVTPLEPGWEGVLTMEISNTTPNPVILYPGEGIAQLLFFRGKRPNVTYSDKQGKYQNQKGIVGPIL